MFQKTQAGLSTFAAAKRLKERFKPPQESDAALIMLRELLAEFEKKDDRFMMWLAQSFEEAQLLAYVETETEIAHYKANGYSLEAETAERELTRYEHQWRIAATLAAYFQAIHIENSTTGLAEFFKARYPKANTKGKKS
jgi:hypothetical protein